MPLNLDYGNEYRKLSPAQAFYQSLQIKDITDDTRLMAVTYKLVSQTYRKFSSHPIDAEAVYKEIYEQEKYYTGSARTVAVSQSWNARKFSLLGCVRFTVGSLDHEFEAMKLVVPHNGWENFDQHNFDLNKSIEFSRLALDAKCTQKSWRQKNYHLQILFKLIAGAYNLAKESYDVSQSWGIMSRTVAQSVVKSGIPVLHVPDFALNEVENKPLFDRFDRYWKNNRIGFYKVMPPILNNKIRNEFHLSNSNVTNRVEDYRG